MRSVLIRADGSSHLGMGHITRELDIAKELEKKDFKVSFLSENYEEGVKIIKKNGFEVFELSRRSKDVKNRIKEVKQVLKLNLKTFELIIVDLPYLYDDQAYLDALKPYCQKLVIVSDAPEFFRIEADLVFLVCSHQDLTYVDNETDTKYYCGLRYFPLRESFYKFETKSIKKVVSKILLTFGGSDPMNYSRRVLIFLKEKKVDSEIVLVSGAGYPLKRYNELLRYRDNNTILLRDHKKMIDLYRKADLCLCSAGNTLIEVLACGVPAIVLPQTQTEYHRAQEFEKKRMIYNMGLEFSDKELYEKLSKLISDEKKRKNFSSRAQNYLDGKGVKRIVEKLVKG